MLSHWVEQELKDVNLSDKRLNDRMGQILSQLGGCPQASIPQACGGWPETVAAYRFFDNKRVSFEKLLEPHIESTCQRIQGQDVVLFVQDTTEIDLTRAKQQVEGAGPLSVQNRRGALLHPMMAFTPAGTSLGAIYAEAWTRSDSVADSRDRKERELDRRRRPIEEKESLRWVSAVEQAEVVAQQTPQTQCICVADSEADIYEALQACHASSLDWIVRASHDRALSSEDHKETKASHVREQVLASECLFTNQIEVRDHQAKIPSDRRRRKKTRGSRKANVEVRAAKVTLRAPRRPDRQLQDIPVNVILVHEADAPEGEVPVEWLLLTSLPIEHVDQVRQVIEYYSVRWMIEVYFRTLKSSCRVESRQFENLDRAMNCLAIYMIVAWRALMISRLSREFPQKSCEVLFDPAEWKSVYHVVHRRPPPSRPPTLQQMTRWIGILGGYLERARDDEPGPQTISLGLQRAHDITCCWNLFGPEARAEKNCV